MTATPPPARRGPRPAGEDTRARITEAARSEFADKGYEGTSMRSVARVAGVDPALVHHYFDGKADLFAQAVVMTRVNPAMLVERVLDGPLEALGERLVRMFLAVWDDPDNQERLVALVRAVHTNDEVGALFRHFVAREVVGQVTRRTQVPDPELRGALAAAQIVGLATTRYVVRMPPMVDASPDELARWLGPTLQRYLVDP
ncbi:MAG TPA: TetR family transcriptional regulator [Lapillicoccus sp.]